MGQLFFQDNIPMPVKGSTTTVTLAATNNGQSTRITIGGQQYALSSPLTCTVSGAAAGVNALDTGTTLGNVSLYYLYAIVNTSTFQVALVASLNPPSSGPSPMPSGYGTAFKLIGAFYSDGFNAVGAPVTITGTAQSDVFSFPVTITSSGGGTVSTGTTGSVNFGFCRRLGDSLEVTINWAFGSTSPSFGTAGSYVFNLPGTLVFDTAKLSANGILTGFGTYTDISPTFTKYPLQIERSGGSLIGRLAQGATGGGALAFNNPVTLAAGDLITLAFIVPVSGWSTSLL